MTAQIFIMLLSGSAIYLVNDSSLYKRRIASVLGLLGQLFWIYSAYTAEQWGILAMCAWYTFSWAKGLYTVHRQIQEGHTLTRRLMNISRSKNNNP